MLKINLGSTNDMSPLLYLKPGTMVWHKTSPIYYRDWMWCRDLFQNTVKTKKSRKFILVICQPAEKESTEKRLTKALAPLGLQVVETDNDSVIAVKFKLEFFTKNWAFSLLTAVIKTTVVCKDFPKTFEVGYMVGTKPAYDLVIENFKNKKVFKRNIRWFGGWVNNLKHLSQEQAIPYLICAKYIERGKNGDVKISVPRKKLTKSPTRRKMSV